MFGHGVVIYHILFEKKHHNFNYELKKFKFVFMINFDVYPEKWHRISPKYTFKYLSLVTLLYTLTSLNMDFKKN